MAPSPELYYRYNIPFVVNLFIVLPWPLTLLFACRPATSSFVIRIANIKRT